MRNLIQKVGCVLTIILGVSAETARADLIVDNLTQAVQAGGLMNSTKYIAQEFSTGSSAYTLTSIVADVGNSTGSYTGLAELVKDSSGLPSTTVNNVLTTFAFPTVGSSYGNVTFNPNTSNVSLSANTNYWFILGVSSGSGTFNWEYSSSNSSTGPGSIGGFANSTNSGGTWTAGPAHYHLMQVNGAAVPEPSSLLMVGLAGTIGLGVGLRRRFLARQATSPTAA